MKILVAGSRDFNNSIVFMEAMINVVCELQYHLEFRLKELEIIHGGAKGTDMMADMFARGYGIKTKVIKPNWKGKSGVYDNSAGIKRNIQMVDYLKTGKENNFFIGFSLNKSKGTESTIKYCRNSAVPSYIFRTEDGDKLILEQFKVNTILGEKYK